MVPYSSSYYFLRFALGSSLKICFFQQNFQSKDEPSVQDSRGHLCPCGTPGFGRSFGRSLPRVLLFFGQLRSTAAVASKGICFYFSHNLDGVDGGDCHTSSVHQ